LTKEYQFRDRGMIKMKFEEVYGGFGEAKWHTYAGMVK